MGYNHFQEEIKRMKKEQRTMEIAAVAFGTLVFFFGLFHKLINQMGMAAGWVIVPICLMLWYLASVMVNGTWSPWKK
jgi:hypothetical protein